MTLVKGRPPTNYAAKTVDRWTWDDRGRSAITVEQIRREAAAASALYVEMVNKQRPKHG